MGPNARYRRDTQRAGFCDDPVQREAVKILDTVYQRLTTTTAVTPLLQRAWNRISGAPRKAETGVYLWGGVGRGKSYLMDAFYECLPFAEKQRIHFYRFMQQTHKALGTLKEHSNPLEYIGRRLAESTRVLCFDEFFVSDITDAMILSGLLRSMFQHGVTLVATSNLHPDDLYADGLQRDRFLPAIELVKRHNTVVHLDGGVDYRLTVLSRAETYHCPLDDAAEAALATSFQQLVGCSDQSGWHEQSSHTIEVLGRTIPVRVLSDGIAWFEFRNICDGPRSHLDYVELSHYLHTVLIGNVPTLDDDDNDAARRFIQLVDEFYDRSVNIILSAAAPPDRLYRGTRLAEEFKRTASRLYEMQTDEYLARPHKP
ncbi:MAG: cell division protein ZapE [Gammaproteobacteria bacterium]|nr:cell division protein ZapE [Gammaproteobacteria bacterium]